MLSIVEAFIGFFSRIITLLLTPDRITLLQYPREFALTRMN